MMEASETSLVVDQGISSPTDVKAPPSVATRPKERHAAVEDVDAVVVGYGPVGALVANLLGQEGVRVEVLEQDIKPHSLPRAGATDDEALRIFQSAGLADDLLPHLDLGQSAQYVSARGRRMTTLHPQGGQNGFPQLVFFYQPDLERVLHRGTERYDCVGVRMGWRVAAIKQGPDGVSIWLRHRNGGRLQRLRSRYVIGCDGGRSTIRMLSGIRFSGTTFAQPWLVIDAELPEPLREVPGFQFIGDTNRPAVTLPLPGNRHRWEFMVLPGEDHRAFAELGNVQRLISPWVDPPDAKILRRIVYTFHARVAEQWRDGRVLLAGDAAHLMPPFAGQGLSAGIRDAHNLCWKLAACLRGEARPDLLDSYERERRPHVWRMTKLTLVSGALVQTRRPGVAALRDAVLTHVDHVPGVGRWLRDGRFKPRARVSDGAFCRDEHRLRRGAGRLFPQPRVRMGVGQYRLFDEVLESGWSIVGHSVDPRTHMSEETARFWERLGSSCMAVVPPGQRASVRVASDTTLVEDADGFALDWFRRYRGDVVILRPDHFAFATLSIRELDGSPEIYRELIGGGAQAAGERAGRPARSFAR